MSQPVETILPGRSIKQKRGQKTYDALIATAFRLLEKRDFEEITIAELAQKAGYSVGAFYARFRSKDEFFDALIAHHIEQRVRERQHLFATLPDDTWINDLIKDVVSYYWKRRRFWRAALIRSSREPNFWKPLRSLGHHLADGFVARISRQAGRRLTKSEETNIRFALQLVLGTINNAIINRPGPVLMGQAEFVENLARAFRLVSGYDSLIND